MMRQTFSSKLTSINTRGKLWGLKAKASLVFAVCLCVCVCKCVYLSKHDWIRLTQGWTVCFGLNILRIFKSIFKEVSLKQAFTVFLLISTIIITRMQKEMQTLLIHGHSWIYCHINQNLFYLYRPKSQICIRVKMNRCTSSYQGKDEQNRTSVAFLRLSCHPVKSSQLMFA